MKLLRWALVVVMIGIGSGVAAAQSDSSNSEGGYVFGTIGRGGFAAFDSGAPAFGGLLLGAGAGHALPHGWFIEGVVDRLLSYSSPDSGDHGDVTALYARMGHRWGPPSQAFRPFVAFAAGGVVDCWRSEYDTEHRMGGTVMGVVLGGDVRAGDKFFVRPEVSALGGLGEVFGRAQISVGYRF